MSYKSLKGSIVIATTLSLLSAPALSVLTPSVAHAAAASSISSQAVRLNATSTIIVRDAQYLMQDKGLIVAFTTTVTNNGDKTLDLMDYYVRLKSGSKVYKAVVSTNDASVTTVAPNSSVNITYYATVDRSTKVTNLSFEIIKWDFAAANYERKLGTIRFPANASVKVPAYQAKTMVIGNSKLKGALKQYYVSQDQNGAYVTVSFLLENVGNSSAVLGMLGFALQTDSLSVFDVSAAELENVSLQPGERKIVTLRSTVPLTILGKSVSLIPYSKDETNKVSLAHSAFAIPALKAAGAVAAGASKTFFVNGNSVNTKVGTAFLNVQDNQTEVEMDYTLKNVAGASMALPGLTFALRTKDNIEYPLAYTKEENAVLLPQIEKSLSLSGTIAKSIDPKTTKLVVRTAATEKQASYVLGAYQLSSSSLSGTIGSSYVHDSSYKVELSSIGRSSQSDSDSLVADIKVTNTSSSSKSIPNLSGYFMINGVKVSSEVKVAALDDSLNIAPKGTYNFVAYTDIPYSASLDKVTFVLTEKVDEKTSKTLYQYSSQTLSTVPTYVPSQAYKIGSAGHKTAVNLVNSDIYLGDKASNYFYAELAALNEETRAASLSPLGAYIQDKNGLIVPVTVSQLKDKLLPGSKALLSASAQLPRNFDATSYKLYVGQAIVETTSGSGTTTGSTTTNDTSTADAVIVKPVSYSLGSTGTVTPLTSFKDLRIAGYNLSLTNMFNTLALSGAYDITGVKFVFDYTLAQDESYDYIAAKHKLMFEFVDQDTAKTTYTKEIGFVSSDSAEDKVLTIGNAQAMSVEFADPDIQYKIQNYKDYVINIYDVYNGAKRLIATKTFTWYIKQS